MKYMIMPSDYRDRIDNDQSVNLIAIECGKIFGLRKVKRSHIGVYVETRDKEKLSLLKLKFNIKILQM